MSLKVEPSGPIPSETVRIAKAAFPKGNIFLKMRDELGSLYQDELFVALYSHEGQPALAPWRLAWVTIMQFGEGLPDRQAADAVRSRSDWKYALSPQWEDSGFDFTALSEFRSRLVTGQAEQILFEALLAQLKERGLVKAQGRQRTDATHVLAAIRVMNRMVCVAETLRATLNSLAEIVPDWLRSFAPDEWYEFYGRRIEETRFPKDETKRTVLIETIGWDRHSLLNAIYTTPELNWLAPFPSIEVLRRVWVQQFEIVEGQPHLRSDDTFPPSAKMICSPYDTDATYGGKAPTWWIGYKVHLTESCDEDAPRLITPVQTSRAGTGMWTYPHSSIRLSKRKSCCPKSIWPIPIMQKPSNLFKANANMESTW